MCVRERERRGGGINICFSKLKYVKELFYYDDHECFPHLKKKYVEIN